MTLAPLTEVGWLAAGALLAVGVLTLRRHLLAWRRARDFDWDPY